MGMDLYSARKPRGKDKLYYRFNIWGWGKVITFLESQGCDCSTFPGDNSGDLVDKDVCTDVADRLDETKARLMEVVTCSEDQLPTHLGESSGIEIKLDDKMVDVVHAIAERRLAGIKVSESDLKFDENNNDWNELTATAYYLGFGEYCRACAKLGGFRVY